MTRMGVLTFRIVSREKTTVMAESRSAVPSTLPRVAGGRLTVQEFLTCGDAGRKALRNQLRQCTNVVNVQGGIEQPKTPSVLRRCADVPQACGTLDDHDASLGERAASW